MWRLNLEEGAEEGERRDEREGAFSWVPERTRVVLVVRGCSLRSGVARYEEKEERSEGGGRTEFRRCRQGTASRRSACPCPRRRKR